MSYTIGILESKKGLQMRLEMISCFQKSSLWRTLFAIIFLSILSGLSFIEAQNQRYSILLDPGHGGLDRGAVSPDGIKEKDIALSMAKKLKAELENIAIDVHMTRSSDELIALDERNKILKNTNADIFISIHINSSWNPSLQGINLWYSPGDRETDRQFAEAIEKDIKNKLPLKWKGIKVAPFVVLQGSSIPAIMVHVGFLTNKEDLTIITSPEFQQRFVRVFATAVSRYINAQRLI
jgi:N-acetylmuramoyl-L-alanine amidase